MIRFDNVVKTFGAHRAVDGLDLEINRGEVVALLGPNGSGKTTSLKMAAGLTRPTSGRVLVGDPARDAANAEARHALSFLPQRVGFPEALSAVEVMEFYRTLRRASVARSGELLALASLNGHAARPVGTYSGGMVQRLGLAVAAVADAPVLILDEPTASLDQAGLETFYALVEAQRRDGRATLFTSHQLGDVERLADRVAILVAGKLAAVLTQAELTERLANHGVMRVRLPHCPAGLVERLDALAPGSRWSGGQLSIPGRASIRAAALDIVRAAGADILSLSADEAHLDTLYRELTGAVS
ncbi:MAG TPA: ABC transporter ATP-binding protein [Polyangia bacterium]